MARRLSAILAADVVGYSRLMEMDEAGTLSALKIHRGEFIDPLFAEHGGRIVKLMGDGALVEFPSVVDAVECAVAVQKGMANRNSGAAENKRIDFRIGINLGDIIIEGDDIYGDGVNIAARLEALAEPGGICVSGTVHEHIAGKHSHAFTDDGEQRVKNMSRPVRVWRWCEGAFDIAPVPSASAMLTLPDKPSIAVLPFTNMSGDPEQEFFADGITEDIITELSRFRSLFVIARNSSFTFKGRAVDVTQVGRTLGVRYVVEGSVRKAGKRVRVTAQLVEAESGNHVWAERYDRDLEDIFELQDEMTQTIVVAIEPELGAFERDRALRKPPQSLDAWETYQCGLWHMWSFTKDDNVEALRLLQRARELDPNFAAAYAYEGYSNFLNVILGYTETPGESLKAALAAAKKAAALDDKEPAAYLTLGRVHMLQGEHDTSIAELEMSLKLNPSFAPAYFALGFALALVGRFDEALGALANAIRFNPRDPLMWAIKAIHSLTYCFLHQYEAAAEWARQSIREPRAVGFWPHAVLAAALGNLGQIEEARSAVDEALRQKPDLSLSYFEKTLPTKQPGELRPYLDGLRKAGLQE
jgi:adenylate cyclase